MMRPDNLRIEKNKDTERSRQRVLIIGAGASGMMAAAAAASEGAEVFVADHMDSPGIKLSLTGNGKCNYTNTDISAEHFVCRDRSFADRILQDFGFRECKEFFESIGISPDIRHYCFDDFGYVYPRDMNASDFRDRLYRHTLELGVQYRFGVPDQEITETVLNKVREGDETSVIIASGSNAYPSTGSDSSIYPVFRALGICFNSFLPALCALYSKSERLSALKGKRVRDEARLITEGDRESSLSCRGEIQFNEHSISGIPVMQLSGYAAAALRDRKRVALEIGEESFDIHRTAGFDRAQVCSGGVDISEIDPASMEARRFPGLFFCGEVIDVYGDCGGFNLHFAWASGYKAGCSAAKHRCC